VSETQDVIGAELGAITGALGEAVPHAAVVPAASIDMPTVYVAREDVIDVARALRDAPALQFAFLVELTAADYFPADPRFEIVYHLACLGPAFAQPGEAAPARRLRMKVRVSGDDARMPTMTGLFPAAGWLEREVYDLFGIGFDGHPDLRRILMADDWEGHPLRKDYAVQIRKETSGWSAMQMTADEFAANIQAARDRAKAEIERS
jgi:NADH-quinone oxidoreductase subunit C